MAGAARAHVSSTRHRHARAHNAFLIPLPPCRQIRADQEESERLRAEIDKTRAQLEKLKTEASIAPGKPREAFQGSRDSQTSVISLVITALCPPLPHSPPCSHTHTPNPPPPAAAGGVPEQPRLADGRAAGAALPPLPLRPLLQPAHPRGRCAPGGAGGALLAACAGMAAQEGGARAGVCRPLGHALRCFCGGLAAMGGLGGWQLPPDGGPTPIPPCPQATRRSSAPSARQSTARQRTCAAATRRARRTRCAHSTPNHLLLPPVP